MKKLLFAMFAIMMATACTNVDEPIGNDANKMEEVASTPGKRLSKEEACKVARNALASFGFKTPSRSERGETAYLYRNTTVSRTSSAQDSLFYVVNFNEGGYALVSTRRDDSPRVYIISPDGQFEDNDNPGFDLYMDLISDTTTVEKPSRMEWPWKKDPVLRWPSDYWQEDYFDNDGNNIRAHHTVTTYENFLTVSWNQFAPYNSYCDPLTKEQLQEAIDTDRAYLYDGRGAVGCGPLAIAQICSFYEKPGIYDGRTLDWSAIKDGPVWYQVSYSAQQQIAYLCGRIGKNLNLKYGLTTGISMDKALSAFKYLGYSSARKSSNVSDCYDAIRNGGVVFFTGYGNNNDVHKGHAWVADGYKHLVREVHVFQKEILKSRYTEVLHYFSFNWGWGTINHAYFLVGQPYSAYGNTYDRNFEYIVNINGELDN